MIQTINEQKLKPISQCAIGDTGYITYCNEKHLVIVAYDNIISLTNPNSTWSRNPSPTFKIELVDITILVV